MSVIANTLVTSYVRAKNGELLPVRVWKPASRPDRVVVALHGMVTHSGWFASLGELLVQRNVALIAPDRRGNGTARGLAGAGDPELLISDVDDVVNFAHELGDDITLLSWCGSANFAVPAAARVAIRRFVLASPGLVPLEHMAARFRSAQPVDGRLPIHFDPVTDFTDDPATQRAIRADALYLRWIPLAVRDAWKQLNPIAREALHKLPIPAQCVLTRTDRMIDIGKTVELLAGIPLHWADGGHGFVVEPAGAQLVARLLGE